MISNVVIFAPRPKRPSAKTAPRRGHDVPAGSTSLPLLVKLLSLVVHLLPRRRRPEGPVPDIREQRLTCLCLAGIHASQVEFMVADSRLRAGWRGHVTSTMFFWPCGAPIGPDWAKPRSEEHTSELQSLMRISYAVFCLK